MSIVVVFSMQTNAIVCIYVLNEQFVNEEKNIHLFLKASDRQE